MSIATTESAAPGVAPLLAITDLAVEFPQPGGRRIRAVEGVDLDVRAGEIVCLVGESGCGKSVTVRSLFDLLPPPGRKGEGRVIFEGVDLATLDRHRLRALCGAQVGYVFLDGQRLPVKKRARPLFGVEHFIRDGIVHHAQHAPPPDH